MLVDSVYYRRKMMNKELCFIIDNNYIYLEQVLVDYMDIPIFFLCKGGNQYYIALCTDIDEMKYTLSKLSLKKVYELLHGVISMRDAILKQNEYWEIISGDEVSLDNVTKKDIKTIDKNMLPEEGARFKILTSQIQNYVQDFDSEYFDNDLFSKYNIGAYAVAWNGILKSDPPIDECQKLHQLKGSGIKRSFKNINIKFGKVNNQLKREDISLEVALEMFNISNANTTWLFDAV